MANAGLLLLLYLLTIFLEICFLPSSFYAFFAAFKAEKR